jgi:hypothetical protein
MTRLDPPEGLSSNFTSCVADGMPNDNQALEYTGRVFMGKSSETSRYIPSWANPRCSYSECRSCAECWSSFTKSSGRFNSAANLTEQDIRLDMGLAAWMRKRFNAIRMKELRKIGGSDSEARAAELKKTRDPSCKRPCHLQRCFSCEQAEPFLASDRKPLGVLYGKQTFADRHLILSTENAGRVTERPVSDTLVMSRRSRKLQVGFPASPLHNGTHFLVSAAPVGMRFIVQSRPFAC